MTDYLGTEIAIIGMAGRFPGAKNIDEFWFNLRDGRETITFCTDEELLGRGVDPLTLRDPNFVKAVARFDGVELFDAPFFGFSHKEAEITDPQHRIFLECAWETMEAAGYDSATYQGAIGVYGGATINTYLLTNLIARPDLINSLDQIQLNIGNGNDFLTTRVSYKLDLKGPSHTVQSACSTSLVAVHLACQSLINAECDMALAGGVSINTRQLNGYYYQEGGICSPDGHCRPFDAQAQGTVFGSGVGLVLLKRFDDALRHGDTIHAVIKGSALNNDGAMKIGYTAPSVDGQAEVISEALANAGVPARSISYIETHGTATALGDPIELRALTKAYRASTAEKQFCAIGSVKSNIGHLDAAAGIASLIKTVLALKHQELPPSLHYQQPNPQIEFASTPFYVNGELRRWEVGAGEVRRAGVSSFGIGGTNAHLIVEEAPAVVEQRASAGDEWRLLVLSARSEAALAKQSEQLLTYLREHPEADLGDVAYTLAMGRRAFSHRRVVVCQTVAQAITALEQDDPELVHSVESEGGPGAVLFLFPGQGAQYAGMGRGLYEQAGVYREVMDHCAAELQPHLGVDLRAVLYGAEAENGTGEQVLNQTWLTQPALYSVEYALARQWQSWGVQAQGMLGHSLGEYVAATLAGVMSVEEGLRLVAARGRLMQRVGGGAMVAVGLSETEVKQRLSGGLSVAAVNGPQLTVVSGPAAEVEQFVERLWEEEGVSCQRLKVEQGFHSALMDQVLPEFESELRGVRLQAPQERYISNVSGQWVRQEEAVSPQYWARQMRETVRYWQGLQAVTNGGPAGGEAEKWVLLEVGPGHTLTRLAMRQGYDPARLVTSLNKDNTTSEPGWLLTSLGRLWLAGAQIEWSQFFAPEKRRRIPLPTYPFERQHYWVSPAHQATAQPEAINDDPTPVPSAAPSTEGQVTLHPRPNLPTTYVAPRSKSEQTIAAIWRRALGVIQIGIDDNFFDLGGDSLVAIQVAQQLKSEFQIDVPVTDLYEGLTIRQLISILGFDEEATTLDPQSNGGKENQEERPLRRKLYQQKQRARKGRHEAA